MDCKGTGTNEVGNIVRIGRGSAGVAVRNRMTCVLVSPKGRDSQAPVGAFSMLGVFLCVTTAVTASHRRIP